MRSAPIEMLAGLPTSGASLLFRRSQKFRQLPRVVDWVSSRRSDWADIAADSAHRLR